MTTTLEENYYRGVYTGKPIGTPQIVALFKGEIVRYKNELWEVEYYRHRSDHVGKNERYANNVFVYYKLFRYTKSMARIEQFISHDDLKDISIPSSVETMAPEQILYSKNYLELIGKN